jgi:hypothetical protein
MVWWNGFAENPNPIFEFTQSWLDHVHTCRTSKGKLGNIIFQNITETPVHAKLLDEEKRK